MENRQAAVGVNALVLRMCGDLEGSLREVWEKAPLEQQVGYALSLNVVSTEIFEKVLLPIYGRYPELDIHQLTATDTLEGATCKSIPCDPPAPGTTLPDSLSGQPIEDGLLAGAIAALMWRIIEEFEQSKIAISYLVSPAETSTYVTAVDAAVDSIRTHILTPLATIHPTLVDRG